MNEIIVLETKVTINDRTNIMHPVILKDSDQMILVDCGYPGMLPQIKADALHKNIDIYKLTKIIITHHDYDHAGCLTELKAAYPDTEILASEEQAMFLSGKAESPRIQQHRNSKMSEERAARIKKTHELFGEPKLIHADVSLQNYEILPWCGGIEIIPTPGHIQGHISLYLREFKTLIAGDALVLRKSGLTLPNSDSSIDAALAKESIRKLMNYDIEKIICYHGGVCEGNIKDFLHQILAQ